MYLTEGYTRKSCDKNDYTFVICQRKSKGFIPYRQLLLKLFGTEGLYDPENGQIFINNILMTKYLKQFTDSALTKFIPQIIKDATPKQIEIFLYYFNLGERIIRKRRQNGRGVLY